MESHAWVWVPRLIQWTKANTTLHRSALASININQLRRIEGWTELKVLILLPSFEAPTHQSRTIILGEGNGFTSGVYQGSQELERTFANGVRFVWCIPQEEQKG